jgi:glutathione S-transferase
VPILRVGSDTISDSTRIIAELERRFRERPLYPADTAAKSRALELEEMFDEEIGVHVRRCVFHVALEEPDFICTLFSSGFGPSAQRLFRLAFPLTRIVMRLDMAVTDENTKRSRTRLDAALDRLEREIGTSGYLVGDSFTSADLTAAALLSPLTFPPEYPYPIPPLPQSMRTLQAEFAQRPAFAWARRMYIRHRGVSLGTDA